MVGKAFGSAKRLELVDLLAQGERTVENLARAAGMGMSTVSAHLQVLKLSNLVQTRREEPGSTTGSPGTTSPPCTRRC